MQRRRVAFVHPDLGIGGAERLVVDAACGLQKHGHEVTLFTSHHDRAHCFDETRDGSLQVFVYGDWLPRSLFGKFHVFFAILRNIYLALVLLFLQRLSYIDIDIIISDQISASVPFLRLLNVPVLFYCHYPDLLLTQRTSLLKKLYRFAFDWFEQSTTGQADRVLVNSRFTASVFKSTFSRLKMDTEVLYPGINLRKYDIAFERDNAEEFPSEEFDSSSSILLLSMNRFERKKNIGLAIQSLCELKRTIPEDLFSSLKLVLAGGYDPRVPENVEYDQELRSEAKSKSLTISNFPDMSGQVIFLHSFTEGQRAYLLQRSRCVLYTPENEHFGIVPVEAMYVRCPVVAADSGGPLESVLNGGTGFLCKPEATSFAKALHKLVMEPEAAKQMGTDGRKHVIAHFSLAAFSNRLHTIVMEMTSSRPKRSVVESHCALLTAVVVALACSILAASYCAL